MRKWQLRAPWWAWLLTLFAVALFSSLSHWQYQRGVHKQTVGKAYLGSEGRDAVPLTAERPTASTQFPLVEISGVYQADRVMFLDGQGNRGRPGYHVWVPLQLTGGAWVLVNRGWVPAPADRQNLPKLATPTGLQTLRGYWRPLPQAGMASSSPDCDPQGHWPRIVVYPTHEQLHCLLGKTLWKGVLLLHPEDPSGYVREWSPTLEMTPEKHFGYALQWLSLMILAIILFLKFNLKRA